jgi:hypothetical protein
VKYSDFQIMTRCRSETDVAPDQVTLMRVSLDLLASLFPVKKGVRLLGVSLSSLRSENADASRQMTLANGFSNENNDRCGIIARIPATSRRLKAWTGNTGADQRDRRLEIGKGENGVRLKRENLWSVGRGEGRNARLLAPDVVRQRFVLAVKPRSWLEPQY